MTETVTVELQDSRDPVRLASMLAREPRNSAVSAADWWVFWYVPLKPGSGSEQPRSLSKKDILSRARSHWRSQQDRDLAVSPSLSGPVPVNVFPLFSGCGARTGLILQFPKVPELTEAQAAAAIRRFEGTRKGGEFDLYSLSDGRVADRADLIRRGLQVP